MPEILKLNEEIYDSIKEEIELFKKTGIPRCQTCKKDFIKIEEQSSKYNSVWETNCSCCKKKYRMCIG